MVRVPIALLAAAAVLVAAYWTTAFFVQRTVLFPAPRRATPVADRRVTAKIALRQPAGSVSALFLAPTSQAPGPAPLFIFAHGNGELADDWIGAFAVPRAWGWAALLLEYPGYGTQPGRPSERSINAVVMAAYDWARGDRRVDGSRIVAYGRSVGGGPAARLASTRPLAGLVLESSIASVPRLARRYLLPPFLVRDRFDGLAALRAYRGPLLVLHGRFDDVVPIGEGRALAAAVPGATFVEMACGHNDCQPPWPIVRSFLEQHGLMPRSTPTPSP